MVFSPRWTAQFAKPLLNQVIALVQRDQAAAIAIVNPAITDRIAQFHKGYAPRIELPHLTVWLNPVTFDLESPHTRAEIIDLTVVVDVGPLDQEMAQELAWDWNRIIDMILTSAPLSDWTASLPIALGDDPSTTVTSPATHAEMEYVLVKRHSVSAVLVEGNDRPLARGSVELQIYQEET